MRLRGISLHLLFSTSLGQGDQNENDPFSANHVLYEAAEKYSAHIHFF